MNFWHEWRGSVDGRPSMLIRRLLSLGRWRLDLHKFIRADDENCFHTHPAKAFRLILWGGYIEERKPSAAAFGYRLLGFSADDAVKFIRSEGPTLGDDSLRTFVMVKPAWFDLVRPEYCHRIHALRNGRSSYSLWLRGPKVAEIEIHGEC